MINEKLNYDEIMLFGHKIHVYQNKIQIYKNKEISSTEFKPTSDKIARYLMDEMFIPAGAIKVELVSV